MSRGMSKGVEQGLGGPVDVRQHWLKQCRWGADTCSDGLERDFALCRANSCSRSLQSDQTLVGEVGNSCSSRR